MIGVIKAPIKARPLPGKHLKALRTPFIQSAGGPGGFDISTIAITFLIIGVIIALSGLILTIFAGATASGVSSVAGSTTPGTLAYNLTHPVVNGMVSFFNFYPTLNVLLGVTGIVLVAGGLIAYIMEKMKGAT